MKKLFFLVTLLCALKGVQAQSDSLTFARIRWNEKQIAEKAILKTYHFKDKSLFNANENISFVEVNPKKSKMNISFAADGKVLKTVPVFAQENNADIVLNGTFFDVKNGGSVDFIKVNDSVVNESRISGKRALHQQAAIAIKKNKLKILKWNGSTNWESNIASKNTMVSGPLLILNDKPETLDTAAFNHLRHPRTAVGIKPNGNVILLTVDGRHENSAGMSLFELTKVMNWLGCKNAINLDGGGSTTLWVKSENGIINYPTDNKKWDHEGERKVANVIVLTKQ